MRGSNCCSYNIPNKMCMMNGEGVNAHNINATEGWGQWGAGEGENEDCYVMSRLMLAYFYFRGVVHRIKVFLHAC